MNEQKPVIVYAASGYMGRLVCASLTKLRIPFVAAGRDQAKLEEVASEMRGNGADVEARVCEHTTAGLNGLVRGAKVIINTSGPYLLLGPAVVEAALAQGVHYMDLTCEQDVMFDLRRDYGERFEQAKLLLLPSASFLWALGGAGAEICLEHAGIHSVEVVYAPPSLQSIGSLQPLIRSARHGGYCIEEGRLAALPPSEVCKVALPNGDVRRGLRIAAGETTFFQGDLRVKRMDTIFASTDFTKVVPVFGAWQDPSQVFNGDKPDALGGELVPRLERHPPAEDRTTELFVIKVTGGGRHGRRIRVIQSGSSPCRSTGFLCAMGAQSLLENKTKRFGYVSLAQAFGAAYVLSRMEEIGMKTTIASLDAKATSTPGSARQDLKAEA